MGVLGSCKKRETVLNLGGVGVDGRVASPDGVGVGGRVVSLDGVGVGGRLFLDLHSSSHVVQTGDHLVDRSQI